MQETKTQPEIVTKTINRAIEMLAAAGAKFKVISPDGAEFGALEVVKHADKKKVFKYKHGTLRDIYIPCLASLKAGEVAQIKVPSGIELEDVRGAACAWMSTHWGNETYTSGIDKTFNTVEILRVK